MIAKPLLKVLRKMVGKCTTPPKNQIKFQYEATDEYAQYEGQQVSDLIKEELLADKPSLIARFGAVEIGCVMDALNRPTPQHIWEYVSLKTDSIGWRSSTIKSMKNNAGFFSPSKKYLEQYGVLTHQLLPQIDILGSWLKTEKYFEMELANAIKVKLNELEPYVHENPWSSILKEKNILVIHPFEKTIRHQYENKRDVLFTNKEVLPEFNLQTIKAVQSIAGNKPEGFNSWFDAFEHMKAEIDKKDFDIAIIGCGAYGMPLAGYIKQKGKKAIHLGGATQMLFGIKGKRWEDNEYYRKEIINEHWIKPFKEDYPLGYENVEGGCYW